MEDQIDNTLMKIANIGYGVSAETVFGGLAKEAARKKPPAPPKVTKAERLKNFGGKMQEPFSRASEHIKNAPKGRQAAYGAAALAGTAGLGYGAKKGYDALKKKASYFDDILA